MSKINENFKQQIASIPTIKRLPSYLNLVKRAYAKGAEQISATKIARELDLEPIQVRKDLAVTGIIGKPRIGYESHELIQAIQSFLNWDKKHKAIIVGCGNLGTALINYRELKNHGLEIVGAADNQPYKIGTVRNGITITPIEDLPDLIQKTKATLVILTVPQEHAQEAADKLKGTNIRAVWNFTNVKLKLPKTILVLMEDLSSGFAVLSLHMPLYKEGKA